MIVVRIPVMDRVCLLEENYLPGRKQRFLQSICMNPDLAREVIACMPTGRTLFHYSKDDYALFLLRHLGGRDSRVHDIRKGTAGKLLEKPAVKSFLAACADGVLRTDLLPERQYLPEGRAYRLSLDIWGDSGRDWHWRQVSRKGVSLVLQMNLNSSLTETLKGCYESEDKDPFHNYCHPARNGDFPTLAWARMDFDLETGEALIEELQTDLLRDLESLARRAYDAKKDGENEFDRYGANVRTDRVIDAWEKKFSSERKHWHEAMLSAALWFLVSEMGCRMIYYHTESTGSYLKRIGGTKPPRSLYTDLPKRFCFDETDEVPRMLAQDKHWKRRVKASPEPMRFFKMAV